MKSKKPFRCTDSGVVATKPDLRLIEPSLPSTCNDGRRLDRPDLGVEGKSNEDARVVVELKERSDECEVDEARVVLEEKERSD